MDMAEQMHLLRESSDDPDSGMFASVEHAIRFALGESAKSAQKDTLARFMPATGSSFFELNRMERAGQAGQIWRKIWGVGDTKCASLILRLGPRAFPCTCGKSCCSRWRPNPEWEASRLYLVERSAQVMSGQITMHRLRDAVVRNWAGERLTLEDIAERVGCNRNTAGRYAKEIGGWLARTYTQAINDADARMRGVPLAEE